MFSCYLRLEATTVNKRAEIFSGIQPYKCWTKNQRLRGDFGLNHRGQGHQVKHRGDRLESDMLKSSQVVSHVSVALTLKIEHEELSETFFL
jgi:hypothetical protein